VNLLRWLKGRQGRAPVLPYAATAPIGVLARLDADLRSQRPRTERSRLERDVRAIMVEGLTIRRAVYQCLEAEARRIQRATNGRDPRNLETLFAVTVALDDYVMDRRADDRVEDAAPSLSIDDLEPEYVEVLAPRELAESADDRCEAIIREIAGGRHLSSIEAASSLLMDDAEAAFNTRLVCALGFASAKVGDTLTGLAALEHLCRTSPEGSKGPLAWMTMIALRSAGAVHADVKGR
jgi:hypothetical protein